MALSQRDVEQTARAAHLALSADEVTELTEQLNEIVDQLAVLHSLDAVGVTPMSHGTTAENVLRPDTVRPGLSQAEALANAPDATDDGFRVPKILDS